MIVMKFGGTSVGDAGRIRQVAEIVRGYADAEDVIVVVSAVSGVTDMLILAAQRAAAKQGFEALQLVLNVQKRSEEHTSELQSRLHLVCRLLLEKKKKMF